MVTIPSIGSILAVIGVALIAVVVLSAIVGVLFSRTRAGAESVRPAGGTPAPQSPAPQSPAPQPAPTVPGQRASETAHTH